MGRTLKYYEDAASPLEKAPLDMIPFRFEGNEYFSVEELARAFAASEAPWTYADSCMREVRYWLEKNMMFEEAANLDNDISGPGPEHGLFRFVHTNARRPFSLLGKLINADNLLIYLEKAAENKASDAEKRIAAMIADGQLVSYYDEYVKLSGKERDSFLYNLLLFMDKKTLREQRASLEEIKTPSVYFWLDDIPLVNGAEIIEPKHANLTCIKYKKLL